MVAWGRRKVCDDGPVVLIISPSLSHLLYYLLFFFFFFFFLGRVYPPEFHMYPPTMVRAWCEAGRESTRPMAPIELISLCTLLATKMHRRKHGYGTTTRTPTGARSGSPRRRLTCGKSACLSTRWQPVWRGCRLGGGLQGEDQGWFVELGIVGGRPCSAISWHTSKIFWLNIACHRRRYRCHHPPPPQGCDWCKATRTRCSSRTHRRANLISRWSPTACSRFASWRRSKRRETRGGG